MIDVRTAMRRAAGFHRNRPAVMAGGRTLTFAEAWERGIRFANALISLGAKPGDRIAVLEDNVLASSDYFLGTAISNTVRVPLYRRNSEEAHRHMLQQSGSSILVVGAEQYDEVRNLEGNLDGLQHVIVRDEGYERWLAGFPAVDPDPEVSPGDFYVIRHSAGTTGIPKGIAFTHEAWMNTERNWTFGLPPFAAGNHAIHVGPISHGSGYLFVPMWLAGGCNVLEPRFDPERLMHLIADLDGTYVFGVPTMLADLTKKVGASRTDVSGLKAFVLGGAPIDRRTIIAAHELFGPKLYQMFGQTECVPGTWIGPEDWFNTFAGSDPLACAGRVMPYTEIEIRDERNQPLPPGEIGEIALRSDGQMTLIWGDPEMTAKRLVDGWVLTGDIGRIDDNGFLYLHDRKDELIISGGFNIWPAELESVIMDLPGVQEVAVFGIPSERWGETPMAMVAVAPGAELTEEDVIESCRLRLGSYKKPTAVEIRTDGLPRTPLGKISRKQLRAPYWADRSTTLGASA
ncbi:AMP-binding protein [Dactylosporangium sp. NPDC005572]|uniref:class I adenylate-forming enzyme family protein n=1 Tax=Dactylosporangium sp. NPDC005572 TaxID=3156889 RepID=UPI0033A386AF